MADSELRVAGVDGGTPINQIGGGGSIPTATLFRKKDWWVDNLDFREIGRAHV